MGITSGRGKPLYVRKRERTQHHAALQASPRANVVPACEAQHAGAIAASLPCPHTLRRKRRLEVFLLLWDEMDDWLGAARHLIRSL